MMLLRKILFSFILGTMIFSLSACEREGPMEEAGESIDETAEEAGDKMEEATD